jgi:hypothetical protein
MDYGDVLNDLRKANDYFDRILYKHVLPLKNIVMKTRENKEMLNYYNKRRAEKKMCNFIYKYYFRNSVTNFKINFYLKKLF